MSTTKKELSLQDFKEIITQNEPDMELAYKQDILKQALNTPCPDRWLKAHPMATTKNEKGEVVPARYLSIDKVEFFLDYLFGEWKIEVRQVLHVLNSVCVTVRVHYRNPISTEWSYHDGVGAKSIQKDSKGSYSDIDDIKDAGVQMALPSAKSYAIKDACDHLGKVFGRDVNRNGTTNYAPKFKEAPVANKESERLIILIKEAKTKKKLLEYEQIITTADESAAFQEAIKKFN